MTSRGACSSPSGRHSASGKARRRRVRDWRKPGSASPSSAADRRLEMRRLLIKAIGFRPTSPRVSKRGAAVECGLQPTRSNRVPCDTRACAARSERHRARPSSARNDPVAFVARPDASTSPTPARRSEPHVARATAAASTIGCVDRRRMLGCRVASRFASSGQRFFDAPGPERIGVAAARRETNALRRRAP